MIVTIAIAGAATVVLIVAIGRIWTDFSTQSDQLSTTITAYRRLAEEHREQLAQLQAQSKTARLEIQDLVAVCDEVEAEMRGKVEDLKDLQARLERLRPQARQVDKNDNDGEWLWQRR
jgi:chromosome segregation ATPase